MQETERRALRLLQYNEQQEQRNGEFVASM